MASPTHNNALPSLFTLSCSIAFAIAIIAFIKTVIELLSLFFYTMKKELYAIELLLFIYISYLITTLQATNLDSSVALVEEVADDFEMEEEYELFFDAETFEEDEFEDAVQNLIPETHLDLLLEHDWGNADHMDEQFLVDVQYLIDTAFDGDKELNMSALIAVSEPREVEFVDQDVVMVDAPPLEDLASPADEASAKTSEDATLMSSAAPTQEDAPRRMYYWETHWAQFKEIYAKEYPTNDKGTGPVPTETGTLRRPVSKYTGTTGMVPMPKPIGWGIKKEVEEDKETEDEEDDGPCFI